MKFFKSKIGLLLLILSLLLMRFLFLDCDVPPLKLTLLYSLDEGPYAMAAFNLLNHGVYSYHFLFGEPAFELIGSFLLNILVYPGLALLGNNYYGFRIASVLSSLLIILIFTLVLKQINKTQSLLSVKNLSFFILLYFITDFSFLANSRIVEPTLFRMLAMMIVVCCFLLKNKFPDRVQKWTPLFIGFIVSLAVFFVYIYNIFIIPAAFFALLANYYFNNKKQIPRLFLLFTLGVLSGFILFVIYLKSFGNMDLKEYFSLLGGASSRLTQSKGGIAKTIVFFILNIGKSSFMDFTTNIFFLNPALLFVFLVSIPVFIKKIITEKNELLWLVFFLIVFLYMQTWFENSFSSRRLVMFLPLVLIVIAASLGSLKEYFNILKGKEKRNFLFYFIAISTISMLVYTSTKVFYAYFFSSEAKYQLDVFIIIVIHLITIFTIVNVWLYLKSNVKSLTIYIFTLLFLFPNIYFAAKYIYINPEFKNRDTMIALAPKVNGQILLGGLSHSFRLYNTSEPVLNFFLYQYGDSMVKKAYIQNYNYLINSKKAKYTIAYSTYNIDANGEKSIYIDPPEVGSIYDINNKFILTQKFIINQNLEIGLYLNKKDTIIDFR